MRLVVKLPPKLRRHRVVAEALVAHDPRVRGPLLVLGWEGAAKVHDPDEIVTPIPPRRIVLRWEKVRRTEPGKLPWHEWHVAPDGEANEGRVRQIEAELEALDKVGKTV